MVGLKSELQDEQWFLLANPIKDSVWKKKTLEEQYVLKTIVGEDTLDDYSKKNDGVILTDNFAPVENMLVEVFSERLTQ